MKSIHHMIAACALLLAAGFLGFLSAPATAADNHGHAGKQGHAMIGAMKIEGAWTRATPGAAKTGAGYLKVTNTGDTADTLIGGTAAFARKVEIHTMEMTDGVMRMAKLDPGLVIEPGETVMLEPGGFHVMLMGMTEKMVEGDTVMITLEFQNAGAVNVMFPVKPIGAMGGEHGGHNHD